MGRDRGISDTHLVNKEVENANGRIQERHMAMRIIHALPPPMHTLQTILIEGAPTSSTAVWDINALKLRIVADERRAHAAGESLRMKLNVSWQSNALAAEGGNHQMKRCNVNNLPAIKALCVSKIIELSNGLSLFAITLLIIL